MRLVRVLLVVVLASGGFGCGGSSESKEEKQLPPNRIPKQIPAPPKK